MASTPTATSSRSCGCCRGTRGASSSTPRRSNASTSTGRYAGGRVGVLPGGSSRSLPDLQAGLVGGGQREDRLDDAGVLLEPAFQVPQLVGHLGLRLLALEVDGGHQEQ